jgi:ribosome-binding protein aMBF1 (putative translation factor)
MSRTLGSARHKALCALIVAERKKAKLQQAKLAKKIKQHQSFVARLESGQRRIDVVEFLELAEAIGFDPIRALKKIKAHR